MADGASSPFHPRSVADSVRRIAHDEYVVSAPTVRQMSPSRRQLEAIDQRMQLGDGLLVEGARLQRYYRLGGARIEPPRLEPRRHVERERQLIDDAPDLLHRR